jgi:pyrrolidone-carboxylate peptidase
MRHLRPRAIRHFLSLLIFAMLNLFSCSREQDPSFIATDLGSVGNAEVANSFEQFKMRAGDCQGATSLPRAIVTGFGLFSGASYNISGVVVESLSLPELTSSLIDLDNFSRTVTLSSKVASGTLSAQDSGARTRVRTMQIDGQSAEVCFILLDVKWDLAAAIIIRQMQIFQPRAVLMTGRGGSDARYEVASLNQTMGYAGFDHSGVYAENNSPKSAEIVSGGPSSLTMSWHAVQRQNATEALIRRLGYAAATSNGARSDNTYICNNVSYAVLFAATGQKIALAGGKITLDGSDTDAQIGFFHYPAAAEKTSHEVDLWSRVLANNLLGMLRLI